MCRSVPAGQGRWLAFHRVTLARILPNMELPCRTAYWHCWHFLARSWHAISTRRVRSQGAITRQWVVGVREARTGREQTREGRFRSRVLRLGDRRRREGRLALVVRRTAGVQGPAQWLVGAVRERGPEELVGALGGPSVAKGASPTEARAAKAASSAGGAVTRGEARAQPGYAGGAFGFAMYESSTFAMRSARMPSATRSRRLSSRARFKTTMA